MPSRNMRTAIYFFYGLDVEIRPIWTPPELFIHLGGAIGTNILGVNFTETIQNTIICPPVALSGVCLEVAAIHTRIGMYPIFESL